MGRILTPIIRDSKGLRFWGIDRRLRSCMGALKGRPYKDSMCEMEGD
jgi:hypothetical protein